MHYKRSRFIARNTNAVGGVWRSCSSYLCALLHEHMTFRSRMAVAQCAMGQIRSRGRSRAREGRARDGKEFVGPIPSLSFELQTCSFLRRQQCNVIMQIAVIRWDALAASASASDPSVIDERDLHDAFFKPPFHLFIIFGTGRIHRILER